MEFVVKRKNLRKPWVLVAALLSCMDSHAGQTNAPAVAEVFAPGVVSGPANEDCATFSPDGDTVFFDRGGSGIVIMVSHRRNGKWSTPQIAPFSGRWGDHDPAMAPDGSFLIFTSNRPATESGDARSGKSDGKSTPLVGGNLWRVDRKGSEWSAPVRLPDAVNIGTRIYSPSVVRDGSVYFQSTDEGTGEFHLWRSQYRAGEYLAPTRVTLGEGGTHELDPAVAPDESFIVFNSNLAAKGSPDRLFIAFREANHWGQPIDLSDLVGSKNNPWGAHLGADGRSLYFTSDRRSKVSWPRTPQQIQDDLVRWQSWDNGADNIWYVSLASVLDAHHAR